MVLVQNSKSLYKIYKLYSDLAYEIMIPLISMHFFWQKKLPPSVFYMKNIASSFRFNGHFLGQCTLEITSKFRFWDKLKLNELISVLSEIK